MDWALFELVQAHDFDARRLALLFNFLNDSVLSEAAQRVYDCVAAFTQMSITRGLAHEPRVVDLAALTLHLLLLAVLLAQALSGLQSFIILGSLLLS